MPTYLTPGVYVEEKPGGPRPIEALGTSTASFIGEAPDPTAHQNQPKAVNNWSQFLKEFAPEGSTSTPLAQAVFGFFLNGGTRCYILNIGKEGALSGTKGIAQLAKVDEIAIVAAPGYSDPASFESVLSHCEKMKDRVAILDAPQHVSDINRLTQVATASATSSDDQKDDEGDDDAPTSSFVSSAPETGLRPRQSDGGYGAFYFPWIVARDPLSSNDLIETPPSGHIAGIYARTDFTRGVHKAPANEAIRGALDVTYRVTHDEQGQLNSNGVNAIRLFSSEGIRVWGARTLAASASEWRYLNVRRLFAMIEASLARSTRWVVFEPNDVPLWKSIKRDISAFLTLLWRQGALMGRTPEEAFFVQCDEETNPPEVVDSGSVVVVIGMAPVKPAEFVIFRISQTAAGAELE